MQSYHERKHFAKHAVDLFESAQALVKMLPDPERDEEPWRCHEVARVVGKRLALLWVDGRCGLVDHTWLLIPSGVSPGTHAILDVYVPGGLPQVAIFSCEQVLPFAEAYRPYPDGEYRSDIRRDVIDRLERELNEPRPVPVMRSEITA